MQSTKKKSWRETFSRETRVAHVAQKMSTLEERLHGKEWFGQTNQQTNKQQQQITRKKLARHCCHDWYFHIIVICRTLAELARFHTQNINAIAIQIISFHFCLLVCCSSFLSSPFQHHPFHQQRPIAMSFGQ